MHLSQAAATRRALLKLNMQDFQSVRTPMEREIWHTLKIGSPNASGIPYLESFWYATVLCCLHEARYLISD